MSTEFAVSTLAPKVPTVHQAHVDGCECVACARETPFPDPSTKAKPVARSDLSDPNPTPSSPPSTPSTGSTRSRRSCLWSDDDDSSSDSEPDRKRAKTRSLSPDLRLPRRRDTFLDFRQRAGPPFVDKTHCILQLPNKFRYLLLRPPRFGKTTFLSILNNYYDIHAAEHFMKHFGPLAVVAQARGAIPAHNQHLCLSFQFSDIYVHSDIKDISDQLAFTSSLALDMFLKKYAAELQLPETGQSFGNANIDDIFAKVFALVKARGYTLFVGVDAYDAPTHTYSFARPGYPKIHGTFATAREIEHLLDSCFWKPLLAGSDVIDKLLVTGTLSLKSPALKHLPLLNLHTASSLQLACGFTEQEALHFSQSILDETLDLAELRGSCGGYIFPSQDTDNDMLEPVLHPQRFIARISELSLQRSDVHDHSFNLLSSILEVLPEKSDVPGSVTLNALVDLLAAGAVDLNEADAALDYDATWVPWTALVQAGALVCERQARHTLRVANSAALALIHARVDTLFANRYDLQHSFLTPWSNYSMSGDSAPFLELLSQVLCDLSRTSFGREHEPTMRGVLELIMRDAHSWPSRVIDPIILHPDNDPRVMIPGYDTVHVWELHTLTLLGMWQAINLNDGAPTVEALQKLHEELLEDDEDGLLARPYRLWSPTLKTMETRLVGSFFDPVLEFPQFVAVGGARVLLRQRPTVLSPDDL